MSCERLSRRVWGRRPGRPDGLHPSFRINERAVARPGQWEVCMDVVVSSRQCEVSERFREHVEDKLPRLEKHDHRIIRVEVLLERERNARQPDRQVRVELTAKSKGPVMRAEAAAEDKMAALDLALDKMSAQMRRAADRRKVHRGQHTPESVARAMARTSNGAT